MKKLLSVLVAVVFLVPSVVAANQFLAVIASGHGDPNVNRVLGIDVTRALVQTQQFRESSRYEEFIATVNAERQRQSIGENRIVEIARGFGFERICFVNMMPAFESFHVTAKLVNTADNTTVAGAEVYNNLATMADLRTAAAEIASAMFGGARQQAAQPVAQAPAPVAVPTQQPQQVQQPQPQVQQQMQAQMQQQQQQFFPQQPQQVGIVQSVVPIQGNASGQQIISLQPGQHIIQAPSVHTIIINVAPQQHGRPQRQERPEGRSEFWKQRWVYLGGSFGAGGSEYYTDACRQTGPYSTSCGYYEDGGGSYAAAFVADFPLLAPVISLEAGAILGYPMLGAYAMGRVGFISEYVEATNDWGFIIGSMSPMVGGTTGFKVGPGMLFFRFQYAHSIVWDESSYTVSAGYKAGVGRRRD